MRSCNSGTQTVNKPSSDSTAEDAEIAELMNLYDVGSHEGTNYLVMEYLETNIIESELQNSITGKVASNYRMLERFVNFSS